MAHVQIKYLGNTIIEGNFEDMDAVTAMALDAIEAAHPGVDVETLDMVSISMDLAPAQPE